MSAAGRLNRWEYRRLWNLWDMLELNAEQFHIAITDLSWVEAFVDSVGRGKTTAQYAPSKTLSDEHKKIVNKALSSLSRHLRQLELWVTWRAVRAAAAAAKLPTTTWREMRESLFDIRKRMQDELTLVTLVALNRREAELFAPGEPHFGDGVWESFPTLEYDIEESAKCLAMERSTAGAFHAIRCLEGGIRALSRCLGIADPTKAADRSWFKLLGTIKGEMDRRWPTSSDRLAGDGRFFEEAYAALASMQNPWRNATMHLDQKYTPEEARHIFEVVGGFMRKLASRCDEDGEPKLP